MFAVHRRYAVSNGVDDFGDQLPGFQVFTGQGAEHQQAADRRGHRFHARQRRGRVGQLGQGRRVTFNGTEVSQVIDDRLAIQRRQAVVDVALAAQFDGHRKAAHRDREALAEALLQLPPH